MISCYFEIDRIKVESYSFVVKFTRRFDIVIDEDFKVSRVVFSLTVFNQNKYLFIGMKKSNMTCIV